MYCERLSGLRGTKSERIMQLIDEKLKEDITKDIPNIVKDKRLCKMKGHLDSLHSLYKKSQKEYKEYRKDIEKYESKLQIAHQGIWSSKAQRTTYKWVPTFDCIVPQKVIDRLQKAQKLSSLGKFREARDIWDSLLTEYKLV